jgi:cell division septal protein FtsQ
MAYNKKPMTENEKKAKLTALKGAHSAATGAMKESMSSIKDSPALKKHVAQMSKDTGMNLKNDSDSIADPMHQGNVVGRHISDENDDCEQDGHSVYDIDARIQELMEQKSRMRRG